MDYQAQLTLDARHTFAIEAEVDERLIFLRKTYMLVFLGLGAAALGGWLGVTKLLPLFTGGMMSMLLLLGGFILTFVIARAVRKVPGVNYLALFGFATFAGITLAPLLWYALLLGGGQPTIVLHALIVTGVLVFGLSAYVLVTKKDFSFMGGALSMGIFLLLGLLVVGFFTNSRGLDLVISGGGALLFAGFVLYDTSRVMKHHPVDDPVGAALDLFLDFFLLFQYVLHFLLMIAGGDD